MGSMNVLGSLRGDPGPGAMAATMFADLGDLARAVSYDSREPGATAGQRIERIGRIRTDLFGGWALFRIANRDPAIEFPVATLIRSDPSNLFNPFLCCCSFSSPVDADRA